MKLKAVSSKSTIILSITYNILTGNPDNVVEGEVCSSLFVKSGLERFSPW